MYIVFDLDQTLLTSDKCVTKYTLSVLKRLQKKNHILVVNTARSFESAKPFIHRIKPNYSILNGGTEIYAYDKLILSYPISTLTYEKLMSEIKESVQLLDYSIQTNQHLYSKNKSYLEKNPLVTYHDFKTPIKEPISKILISTMDFNKISDISKKYGLYDIKYLDSSWIRISPSTKWLGNQHLFQYLNDSSPKDICFGDDHGDVEMLKNAYHGVVMLNSEQNIKDGFINVTLYDCDHDGVARYLENLERVGLL